MITAQVANAAGVHLHKDTSRKHSKDGIVMLGQHSFIIDDEVGMMGRKLRTDGDQGRSVYFIAETIERAREAFGEIAAPDTATIQKFEAFLDRFAPEADGPTSKPSLEQQKRIVEAAAIVVNAHVAAHQAPGAQAAEEIFKKARKDLQKFMPRTLP